MALLTTAEFNSMFSIPREPMTEVGPGQYRELTVAHGKRVVITDVYIENRGTGNAAVTIQEQTGPVSFEVRYAFFTKAGEKEIVDYTTGLKLGDLAPIAGTIRIQNDPGSTSSVLVRANGFFV